MPQPHPQTSTQLPLPLYRHAVFFDWYGTLSTSRFWETITDSATHPLGPRLRPAVTDLFTQQSDVIAAWMRGHTTDKDVCNSLGVELPKRYRADFLHRALLNDCRTAIRYHNPDDLRQALNTWAPTPRLREQFT